MKTILVVIKIRYENSMIAVVQCENFAKFYLGAQFKKDECG